MQKGMIGNYLKNLIKKIKNSNSPTHLAKFETWKQLKRQVATLQLNSTDLSRINPTIKQQIEELESQANELEKELSVLYPSITENSSWIDVQKNSQVR